MPHSDGRARARSVVEVGASPSVAGRAGMEFAHCQHGGFERVQVASQRHEVRCGVGHIEPFRKGGRVSQFYAAFRCEERRPDTTVSGCNEPGLRLGHDPGQSHCGQWGECRCCGWGHLDTVVATATIGTQMSTELARNPPESETDAARGYSGTYGRGEFDRDTDYIERRILDDPSSQWPVEAGRYRLVVARACPWAHRAVIVRRLLGLEDAMSMAMAGPTHDADSWTFDLDPGGIDPVLGIPRLKDAYDKAFPNYPKGITVPALVDIPTGQVVTNDFPQMTLDMSTQWTAHHRDGAPDLYPVTLRDEIHALDEVVYNEVNNGVYRCGFAGSQQSYEHAYHQLFDRLDWLSDRLGNQRYLVGDTITEADVRLFTTLARFDTVYHGHFKCNRSKLTEMPVLWAYARDLFQTPGFGDTIDFVQIKSHYYEVHLDLNPTGVVPAGPTLDNWADPHHREHLGGRPFGDGAPPPPPLPAETVPAANNPALALLG